MFALRKYRFNSRENLKLVFVFPASLGPVSLWPAEAEHLAFSAPVDVFDLYREGRLILRVELRPR